VDAQLRVQPGALVFGAFAGRQVARDFREPDQLPGVVAQRRQRHARPVLHVTLAGPPPLLAEDAVARRQAQLMFRLSGLALFGGGQDAIMAADDLLFAPALDPLSARIPARHAPVAIDQKQRVILDRLDEQPVDVVGNRAWKHHVWARGPSEVSPDGNVPRIGLAAAVRRAVEGLADSDAHDLALNRGAHAQQPPPGKCTRLPRPVGVTIAAAIVLAAARWRCSWCSARARSARPYGQSSRAVSMSGWAVRVGMVCTPVPRRQL
jgi:hypothetical protein